MTHRGPFQPLPFCDSVILILCWRLLDGPVHLPNAPMGENTPCPGGARGASSSQALGGLGSFLGIGVGRDKCSLCLLRDDSGLDAQDRRAGLKAGPARGAL